MLYIKIFVSTLLTLVLLGGTFWVIDIVTERFRTLNVTYEGEWNGEKFRGSFYGSKIVGGRSASPNERPFQVTIQWEGNDGHWCGGSIIDSEYVLTAGHCVKGLSPAELLVFAGVLSNTKESSEDTKVVRQVTKIFLHEGFVRKPLNNDIAVLKVSPAFPTDNPAVRAISLRKDVAPDGAKCTVSGWGRLAEEEKTMPQILQVAVLHFMTYEKCRSKYGNYKGGNIEPGMICAEDVEGEKCSCNGDSGGPLLCEGLLTGVVSWGVGCSSAEYPEVFTDVAYYKDWIESLIRKGKEEL